MHKIRSPVLGNAMRRQFGATRNAARRINTELRAARGLLWSVAGGVVLWCLIGLAVWFAVH